MAKTLEIFKAGTHVSGSGDRRTWTVADLKEIASTYNADHFKAPLIVSHDTQGVEDHKLPDSELAYGYPDSLEVKGSSLVGKFSKIVPQVSSWIQNGQIFAISPSIYLPNSPSNPTPGKFSLRHIALLGKSPPAVKGMEAPSFSIPFTAFAPSATAIDLAAFNCEIPINLSEDEEEMKTRSGVAMQDEEQMAGASSGVSKKKKKPNMNATDDSVDLEDEEEEDEEDENEEGMISPASSSKKKKTAPANMSESSESTVSTAEFAELKASFNALKAQAAQERQLFALKQAEQERRDVSSFVGQQVEDGRLLGIHRESWVSSLLAIPTSTEVSYAESESPISVRDRIMQMLGEMPTVVELSEVAGVNSAPNGTSQQEGFAPVPGYSLDPSASESMKKALSYCEKHNLDASDNQQLITAIHAVSK